MATTQECDAPLRWRECYQARVPYALPPDKLSACVLIVEPSNHGSRVRGPLATAYRHFAYRIGRNSTPSSSEMGRKIKIKGLFMQMMSEPCLQEQENARTYMSARSVPYSSLRRTNLVLNPGS